MAAIETQQVIVERDIPFGHGGARDLLCDVYRPPSSRQKGVGIVHAHGGAFLVGSKAAARTARPLAALGYLCVSTQYRLSDEAKWPAQVHDVKACIRWARANAGRLEIDPHKIVVLGHSAGGHLALVAAGTQSLPAFEGEGGNGGVGTELAACVAFYPPATAGRRPDGSHHPLLEPDAEESAYQAIGPISFVGPAFPPTILLHGAADGAIPVEASFQLYRALTEARVPVELHVLEGVTHMFDTHEEFAELATHCIDLFLDRHVANPRAYPATDPIH